VDYAGGSEARNKDRSGPFPEGQKPGFADLVFQVMSEWVKVADEYVWKELLGVGDGEVRKLRDALDIHVKWIDNRMRQNCCRGAGSHFLHVDG
jgi:hypothetical protein